MVFIGSHLRSDRYINRCTTGKGKSNQKKWNGELHARRVEKVEEKTSTLLANLGQRIRRVGILAAVPNDAVIVDDVVESGTECVARLVVGSGVVVFGWISLGKADEYKQTSERDDAAIHFFFNR
jgi:hypothetical protein